MEKTPLTNLIEQLDNEIKKVTLGGISYYGLIQAKQMALSSLNEEKKVISMSFTNGEQNVWDREKNGNKFEYEGGEDYFNKNYNNKPKENIPLWQSTN